MRADEANGDGEELVLHADDDPVLVALDVEHHAVSSEEAGRRVLGLDDVGTAPVGALNLGEPGEERLTRAACSLANALTVERLKTRTRGALARSHNGNKAVRSDRGHSLDTASNQSCLFTATSA
jgi:hypothetical protein